MRDLLGPFLFCLYDYYRCLHPSGNVLLATNSSTTFYIVEELKDYDRSETKDCL